MGRLNDPAPHSGQPIYLQRMEDGNKDIDSTDNPVTWKQCGAKLLQDKQCKHVERGSRTSTLDTNGLKCAPFVAHLEDGWKWPMGMTETSICASSHSKYFYFGLWCESRAVWIQVHHNRCCQQLRASSSGSLHCGLRVVKLRDCCSGSNVQLSFAFIRNV